MAVQQTTAPCISPRRAHHDGHLPSSTPASGRRPPCHHPRPPTPADASTSLQWAACVVRTSSSSTVPLGLRTRAQSRRPHPRPAAPPVPSPGRATVAATTSSPPPPCPLPAATLHRRLQPSAQLDSAKTARIWAGVSAATDIRGLHRRHHSPPDAAATTLPRRQPPSRWIRPEGRESGRLPPPPPRQLTGPSERMLGEAPPPRGFASACSGDGEAEKEEGRRKSVAASPVSSIVLPNISGARTI